MIFDRTASHLSRLLELVEAKWENLSAAERSEYYNGDHVYQLNDLHGNLLVDNDGEPLTVRNDSVNCQRGAYNMEDVNRVGGAMNALKAVLLSNGYYITWTAKDDWTRTNVPSVTRMDEYIQYVDDIKSQINTPAPAAPANMENMTPETANAIEQIIFMADAYLTLGGHAKRHCGTISCGQGGLIL